MKTDNQEKVLTSLTKPNREDTSSTECFSFDSFILIPCMFRFILLTNDQYVVVEQSN